MIAVHPTDWLVFSRKDGTRAPTLPYTIFRRVQTPVASCFMDMASCAHHSVFSFTARCRKILQCVTFLLHASSLPSST